MEPFLIEQALFSQSLALPAYGAEPTTTIVPLGRSAGFGDEWVQHAEDIIHGYGDRPAGVVPATVAEHLLDTGVALWRTVVIVGDGPWAPRVAERARRLGARIIAV